MELIFFTSQRKGFSKTVQFAKNCIETVHYVYRNRTVFCNNKIVFYTYSVF